MCPYPNRDSRGRWVKKNASSASMKNQGNEKKRTMNITDSQLRAINDAVDLADFVIANNFRDNVDIPRRLGRLASDICPVLANLSSSASGCTDGTGSAENMAPVNGLCDGSRFRPSIVEPVSDIEIIYVDEGESDDEAEGMNEKNPVKIESEVAAAEVEGSTAAPVLDLTSDREVVPLATNATKSHKNINIPRGSRKFTIEVVTGKDHKQQMTFTTQFE